MWFGIIEAVNDLVDLDEIGVVEDEVVSKRGESSFGDCGDGFGVHEVGSQEVGKVSLTGSSGVVKMDS